MKNTYKIIWSDEALSNLKQIIVYLEQNWTIKEIKKFAFLLDRQLIRIQNNPLLFAESNKQKNFRKSVLTKQVSIYYRIKSFEIHILTLFDNRQNPKKLNKI
jgi:plasmid stabilization system protein ParE